MSALKIVDTILLAVSAIITAAKSIIRFIGYIGKLRHRTPATGTS